MQNFYIKQAAAAASGESYAVCTKIADSIKLSCTLNNIKYLHM